MTERPPLASPITQPPSAHPSRAMARWMDDLDRRMLTNEEGLLTVDLSSVPTADQVTIGNTNGADAVIAAANDQLAGVMSAGDKTKLDGVEPSAKADQTAAEIIAALDTALGGTSWRSGQTGAETVATINLALGGSTWQEGEGEQISTAGIIGKINTHLGGAEWQSQPAFGALAVRGGTTAETTVDATPRKVAAWNATSEGWNMTADHTADEITADVVGVYMASLSIAFSGSVGKEYSIEVRKNDVDSGFGMTRKLGSSGNVETVAVAPTPIRLVAGDTMSVYQSSTDGGTILTVVDAVLSLHRISD